jgi:hypothetical protein
MKAHHYCAATALAASAALTLFGIFKGAAFFVGLATAIELIASAFTDKDTNA